MSYNSEALDFNLRGTPSSSSFTVWYETGSKTITANNVRIDSVAVVPEPTSFILLSLGIVGLVMRMKYHK